jgi:hypothetical protein
VRWNIQGVERKSTKQNYYIQQNFRNEGPIKTLPNKFERIYHHQTYIQEMIEFFKLKETLISKKTTEDINSLIIVILQSNPDYSNIVSTELKLFTS